MDRVGLGVQSVDGHRPLVRGQQAAQVLEERRLARPVRATEQDRLAVGDGQRAAVERAGPVVVAVGDAARGDHRGTSASLRTTATAAAAFSAATGRKGTTTVATAAGSDVAWSTDHPTAPKA
ncbi:MAG: hypothetical protein A07HB70_01334 [uncultured archaeon A07HB70]|nr:MAG: hypothetical protein A07HB70_01334 [uncultured archaeon A07HB70]